MKKSSPLLDTNIIIDLLNGNENALAFIESLEVIFVPAVTVFEVLAGCYGEREAQKDQAMRIFDVYEIIDLSVSDAIYAANLLLKSPSKSKKRILDYFIAGTANSNYMEIATRNPGDFKTVKAFSPYHL